MGKIWWSFQIRESVSKSELVVTVEAFLAHSEVCSTYLVTTDKSPGLMLLLPSSQSIPMGKCILNV